MSKKCQQIKDLYESYTRALKKYGEAIEIVESDPAQLTHILNQIRDHKENLFNILQRRFRTEMIIVGEKSADQLIDEVNMSGIRSSSIVDDFLRKNKFGVEKSGQEVTTIRLTLLDLGFKRRVTTSQMYKRVQDLGFDFFSINVPFEYLLQSEDQFPAQPRYMPLKGIENKFSFYKLKPEGPDATLVDFWAQDNFVWSPSDEFVFCLRDSSSQ